MKTKASIVAVAGTLAVIIIYMLATTRFDSKQGFLENNWNIIFWMLAGIGALALLVFGLKSRTSPPTAGAAPEKSKVPKWIKYPAWIVILAGLILEGYREWDILAGWSWDFKGIADKAIAEKIVFSDVSGSAIDLKKFKSKNTRYFRVRIRPDKDTYWGTCADGEIFEGISIQNERIREKFSRTADLTDGNIVVQGDSGSPTRDGGLVYIHEKTPQVFLDVRKKGHPGCKTDAPLTADIQFVAENP